MSYRVLSVIGECPACARKTLFVGEGGYITCSNSECPNPEAASQMLENSTKISKALQDGVNVLNSVIKRDSERN